jgi:hypothetical protein
MSCAKVCFALCLTLICLTAAVVPASAQHFQEIPTPLSQISAGYKEVWGLKFPGGLIYRLVPGNGVTSADFQQVNGSLSQVAVGGGSLFQPDQVWGVNGAGVFSFDLSTNAYTQHNPSGPATYFNHIAVGEGDLDSCHPYEVWGLASSVLASSGLPYRYNFCQGGKFEKIPLPSGSTTPFTQIATAPRGSDVWAVDANGVVWHLNACACSWTEVQALLYGVDKTIQQITVGVTDVWALDSDGNIYRYNPYFSSFVFLREEEPAGPYAGFAQIAAGGDGVWAMEKDVFSENGFRFDPLVGYFVPEGELWTQVAVGSGAGIWVINSSDQVLTWVP